jgi:putative PEP-CTERM system histidine kinase
MPGFGVLSYVLACAAFLVLAILAFVSDRGLKQGRALVAAGLVSAAWAGQLAFLETGRVLPVWVLLAAEALRYAAWTWFLLLLLAQKVPKYVRYLVPGLLAAWALFAALAPDLDRVIIRGCLVASLLGLMALEQIYRNAPANVRRNLTFLVAGVGGIFAFDLFLFSQAELFRGLDADSWHARGVVNALLVPFLILGARRLPHVRFELFVSRKVTFYTSAFVAVGIYILVTAGVGFLIRELGGEYGEAMRIAFLGGAVAVLGVLVGSDSLRRQLRVFLSKHFYRSKYDYRLEWLRFIRTLGQAGSNDVSVAAVQSVAQILDSGGGILFRQLDGASDFVPVGKWPESMPFDFEVPSIPASAPLVDFLRARRWIVDLREREQKPALYDNLEIPDWLGSESRWRLVSPILLGDKLLGFFLLIQPPEPFRLIYEDRDLLNTAGQHVATLLALQDSDRRVAELSQFEAYNRLTAFVMHDLKNSAAQLSLLVANAARHKHNPEFIDDAISTIASTSERMMRLIEQLRQKSETSASRPVKVLEALQAAVER